jgi:hypothetical protein
MKSLYHPETLKEVLTRIDNLKVDSSANWGKMNSSQMMEHCARTLEFATGKTKEPRLLIGYLLGGFFKTQYYNEKPWRQNSPTSKSFTVVDQPQFEASKLRLINLIKEFSNGGPEKCTTHPSPFFGKLTPEQIGMGTYKHLDHHLLQFGN